MSSSGEMRWEMKSDWTNIFKSEKRKLKIVHRIHSIDRRYIRYLLHNSTAKSVQISIKFHSFSHHFEACKRWSSSLQLWLIAIKLELSKIFSSSKILQDFKHFTVILCKKWSVDPNEMEVSKYFHFGKAIFIFHQKMSLHFSCKSAETLKTQVSFSHFKIFEKNWDDSKIGLKEGKEFTRCNLHIQDFECFSLQDLKRICMWSEEGSLNILMLYRQQR